MARPKNPSPQLKKDLAQVSRQLVDEKGPDGLTVRAAAIAAGVTSNAPYFYYPGGPDELLASVASEGFVELLAALEHRPVAGPPVERVRQIIRRYVRFGVEHPNLYRAMFHARLADPLADGTDERKGQQTYDELRGLKELAYLDLIAPLEELHAANLLRGDERPDEAPGLALAALAHGLVGEFIDEGLLIPRAGDKAWSTDRRKMTVAVTEVLLHGLVREA